MKIISLPIKVNQIRFITNITTKWPKTQAKKDAQFVGELPASALVWCRGWRKEIDLFAKLLQFTVCD